VIPLFIKQIKEGRPLSITDPEMTRFMMSIEDAVDLVVYAFEKARPGDIFVQKAPAATIGVLAEALKRIFGSNVPLNIIGTRHGEKLYETLLTREELARAEDLGKYFRIPADTRDLNYDLYFTEGEERVSREHDYNSHNTRRLNVEELMELLLRLEIVQQELKEMK
jgi:UDP-glucose 4-epimerase